MKTVHRVSSNPPFSTVPAHRVMDVNLSTARFSFKPVGRPGVNSFVGEKGLLEDCLRRFDFFVWADDSRLTSRTSLGVPLKVANFCDSCAAMSACIHTCQPLDVLCEKCVPVENTDRKNVFKFCRRVSLEVPDNFSCFCPLGLIHAYPEPLSKSFPLVEVLLNLVQLVEQRLGAILEGAPHGSSAQAGGPLLWSDLVLRLGNQRCNATDRGCPEGCRDPPLPDRAQGCAASPEGGPFPTTVGDQARPSHQGW